MCGKRIGNGFKIEKQLRILLRQNSLQHLINFDLKIFGLMFLRCQSYDFDVIAHTGAPLGVE